MTARTTAQRQAALRERRKKAGLSEVRGVWAPRDAHDYIRDYARAALVRLERGGLVKRGTK